MTVASLLLLAPSLPPQSNFAAPRLLSPLPRAIEWSGYAVGDLDGDGLADAVVVGEHAVVAWSISESEMPERLVLDPELTQGVVVGIVDVDGDGRDEIVCLGSIHGSQSWVVYEVPTGSRVPIRASVSPGVILDTARATLFGDVDGDGDDDLVVEAGQGGVADIRWVETDGVPGAAATSIVGSGGGKLQDLVDVDQDGLLDVVFASGGRSRVAYGAPAGGFEPAVDPLAAYGSVFESDAADMDGDGLVDFVGRRAGRVVVARGAGARTFSPPAIWDNQTGGWNVNTLIAAGDLDGDGDVDCLTQESRSPGGLRRGVLENVGGAFAPSVQVPDVPYPLAHGNYRDLDGDGSLDYARYDLPAPVLALAAAPLGAGAFGPERSLLGPVRNTGGLLVADMDGDGDVDVMGASGVGIFLSVPGFDLFENRGWGAYGSVERQTAPFNGGYDLVAGEFNGDGLMDVLAVSSAMTQLALRAGAGYVDAGIQLPGSFRRARIVDFDDDGDQDIVQMDIVGGGGPGVLTVHLNDGTATAWTPLAAGLASNFDVVDLDGDGRLDLFASTLTSVSASPTEARWYRQNGSGLDAPVVLETTTRSGRYTLANVDGDGLPDLVLIADDGAWWRPRLAGSVAFGPSVQLLAQPVDQPSNAFFADFDQDGLGDLVTLERISAQDTRVDVRRAVGPGVLSMADPVASVLGARYLSEPVDVDADGDLDIIGIGGVFGVPFLSECLAQDADGVPFCPPANGNAAGRFATLSVAGDVAPASTDLRLRGSGIPVGSFSMLVNARTFGAPLLLPGSQGQLCLTGGIGRYVLPGELRAADLAGTIEIPIDPAAMRTPNGNVPVQPGESWSFQLWHRDTLGGAPTSNLSEGLTLQF